MNQNKKAIMWLSAGHFMNDVYTGILNPVMPFIAAKLGITMAMATLVISISNIFSSLLQPIFGFFADNMLKRLFIFWGLVLSSIFLPLMPLAKTVPVLILFMILGSLGSSFYHPQSSGYVNKFASEATRANDMGFFISMGSLGFSFGPLISAYVVQFWGMENMPALSIFGLLLVLTMFWFVPKMSDSETMPEYKSFKTTFKDILSCQKMNYLMIISMMKSLVTTSCCTLLPFLWKNMGYTAFYIGLALFLFIIAGGIGSLVSHRIEDRVGTKKLLYISMSATLPMLVLFALTYQTHPIFSMITFVVIGFTTMRAQPVTIIIAQTILPKYKSVVSGFINGFSWGVVAICLSAIGLSAEKFGITNILVFLSIFPIWATKFVKKL